LGAQLTLYTRDQLVAYARTYGEACARAAISGAAEPVAWRYRYASSGGWFLATEPAAQWAADAGGFEEEPLYTASPPPPTQAPSQEAPAMCQPNGLMFDALGEPRERYVRVTLDRSHCVMHPSEGDRYLADARANGDESNYVIADVWLSEREFDDLPEHEGF
jgi:hypothetical protein